MIKVVKQSEPTTRYGRQIAYDREIVISICRRLLEGEDLRDICAKPPMPIGGVFLWWIQEHPEARAIYRSVENFESDRKLAKVLRVPMDARVSDWETRIRANCERGWPADSVDRQYIRPDWSKVYPLVGGPPVWSTENMEAYIELLNEFTQLLEPRDVMELIWTKEAADASWEAARKAREKNGLPERKYQQRLQVAAEVRRLNGAAETAAAKPASALDHSRGLEAGFKHYQGLDIAQSRAMKRRDNTLRLIARWRKGLAPKARALSDKFIAEEALAEHYDAAHLLADAETDNNADEAMEAAPPARSRGRGCAPARSQERSCGGCAPARFQERRCGGCAPARSQERSYGGCTPARSRGRWADQLGRLAHGCREIRVARVVERCAEGLQAARHVEEVAG